MQVLLRRFVGEFDAGGLELLAAGGDERLPPGIEDGLCQLACGVELADARELGVDGGFELVRGAVVVVDPVGAGGSDGGGHHGLETLVASSTDMPRVSCRRVRATSSSTAMSQT